MARSQTITITNDVPSIEINVYRDETTIVSFVGGPTASALTISATPAGAPIVEIPGTGSITITPEAISSLNEGKSYPLNIWDTSDEDDPQVRATGTFKTVSTIAPTIADYPTQWIGGTEVVFITQAQYDALGTYDEDVLYVVV